MSYIYQFHILLPFGRDMNILSQISILKIVQNVQKKWLSNLSEELDTKSTTSDMETSMKQILIWC